MVSFEPSPEWEDGLGLGVPELDAADREMASLVRELNRTIAADPDAGTTQELMDRILHHAVDHFAQEERVMLQAAYPLHNGHAALHRQMKAEFEYAREQFGRSELRSAWPAFGLLVEQLFFDHLRQESVRYRNFVNPAGENGGARSRT
jgi:hemerythrin-like metal-binding protein